MNIFSLTTNKYTDILGTRKKTGALLPVQGGRTMKARTYSIIEFKRILENNGYRFLRHAKGDHCIYSNGERTITIKRSHVNKMIARRLIREYNLKVDD